jgi:hypothetical protein
MKISFAASLSILCLLACDRAASAQVFGPETFTLSSSKAKTTRAFSVSDTSIPYTLTLINGDSEATRIRKGTVTLNGKEILGKKLVSKRFGKLVVAIAPNQQNEIAVSFKGSPGSFATIAIEPTPLTLLNDPSSQSGIGYPYCVTVDQTRHRAYISDRHLDSLLELDIAQASLTRSYSGIDGDQTTGNGATAGAHFNPASRSVVAVNEGSTANPAGSLAVLDLANGQIKVTQLMDSGSNINPVQVAVNSNSNVAAFNARYAGLARRAFFFNIANGMISSRSESMILTGVAANQMTGEFVFVASDTGSSPALFVYSASPPFQRIRRIDSTAQSGTAFERIDINAATNIAVAVNHRDGAVFLFDLAAGAQTARIPVTTGQGIDPIADVAINPEMNLAVVVSRYTTRVSIINLTTKLVMAEIPLPQGVRPLGVGIDNQSNRAIISENGLSSTQRNGSILVIQLPR